MGHAVDALGVLEADAPGAHFLALVVVVVDALAGIVGLARARVGDLPLIGAGNLPHATLHRGDGRRHATHGRGDGVQRRVLARLRAQGPQRHLPVHDEAVHRGASVDGLGHVQVVGTGLGGVDGIGVVGGRAHGTGVGAHAGRGLADVEGAAYAGQMALGEAAVHGHVLVFAVLARHRIAVLVHHQLLALVAARVLVIAVVVHIGHHFAGVRVNVGQLVVYQHAAGGPLEVRGRLAVEPVGAQRSYRVDGHGGLQVGLAGLEGERRGRAQRIQDGRESGVALGVVDDTAFRVAVHHVDGGRIVASQADVALHELRSGIGIVHDGHVHRLVEGVGPARGLGQPGGVLVLSSEVGLGGLGAPGADSLQLLGVGERVAIGVGQTLQGRLLIAHIVDAGAHLQRDGVAGAHVAVGPHVVPERRQHAGMLHEFQVGGIVGRRQFEHHHFTAVDALLHIGALGQIVQIVHIALGVVFLHVAVGVVVGLHAHTQGPPGLHQLLGRQALVLRLLLRALGELRRAGELVEDGLGARGHGGIGMAVLVGALDVERVVVAHVVGQQLLVAGAVHVLAEVSQQGLVVEGHLLGQVQREHQLGVL